MGIRLSISSLFKRRRLAMVLVLTPVVLALLFFGAKLVKTKHTALWVPAYVGDLFAGRYHKTTEIEHLVFLLCDHWEPGYGESAVGLAGDWLDRFEKIAARNLDSQGRPFQYSWFYPIDNFEPEVLARLSESVQRGFGEIEVHWHHSHSAGQGFEEELKSALKKFQQCGALTSKGDSIPRFAFIHGNWTLDNSGAERYCGVNNEIEILTRNGCYADFTFPAIGTSAQPRAINRIFYSEDSPQPKSYDESPIMAEVQKTQNSLMIFQGPLGLDFRNPLIFLEFASLDDAEGSGFNGKLNKPDSPAGYFKAHRVPLWLSLAPRVEGKPEWAFVKIHAHGVQHREVLLGGEMEAMLTTLRDYCQDQEIILHFVTAREAFNLVKAAEAQVAGPPEIHYDFLIPPPINRGAN